VVVGGIGTFVFICIDFICRIDERGHLTRRFGILGWMHGCG
jgi:hypothetical protein